MSPPVARLLFELCFVCIRPILTNLLSVEHFCPLNFRVSRSLTSVNLLRNNLGDGAAAVVAAAKQNGNIKTLCGTKEGQSELKHIGSRRSGFLKAPDAVLLSFDLEFNRALTSLDLAGNEIGAGGVEAIAGSLAQSA